MPTVAAAFDFLEREWAPARAPLDSLLYVGHRSDTSPWWARAFRAALGNPDLTVIDVVPANLDSAAVHGARLVHADVRAALDRHGLVFWDEGPEHLPREESLACLSALMAAHGSVLVSCPWGLQPQGFGPSDPEFHHWGPEPADFTGIGMECRVFGTRFDGAGLGHGNLLAWSP